jgi:hypothetical protein
MKLYTTPYDLAECSYFDYKVGYNDNNIEVESELLKDQFYLVNFRLIFPDKYKNIVDQLINLSDECYEFRDKKLYFTLSKINFLDREYYNNTLEFLSFISDYIELKQALGLIKNDYGDKVVCIQDIIELF